MLRRDGLVSFEAFERLMLRHCLLNTNIQASSELPFMAILQRLSCHCARYLSDHTYDPDDSETLLAAFRVVL